MLIFFRVPLRWPEVLKRTIAEIGEDNCLGLAAQLAFCFFLSLFPALLFLVALVGYLPIEDTLTHMLTALGTASRAAVRTACRSSTAASSWRMPSRPSCSPLHGTSAHATS